MCWSFHLPLFAQDLWSNLPPWIETAPEEISNPKGWLNHDHHICIHETESNKYNLHNIDSAKYENYSYHWIFYYDFFTTLTALHQINNLNANEKNNLYFYYNVDIKSNLQFRKIKWDVYLFNDYGRRYFFDSISLKTQDQLNLKNSVYYPLYHSKIFFALAANTQTQLFNTYQYRTNMLGEQEQFLYDGFMSPGTIVYSGGLTYEAGGNSIINIGLGSSKVTKIKNQKIFETRNESNISGLEQGVRKKKTFGIAITTTVPLQKISRHLFWEFYENLFAPLEKLSDFKTYTLEINNVFHVLLLKYVRLSLRSKVNYDYELNPKPVFQNQISLGFFLSNHL